MKHYILALVLAMASINAAIAANPIREGNMISGHVLVKGSEENIPYATTGAALRLTSLRLADTTTSSVMKLSSCIWKCTTAGESLFTSLSFSCVL